MDFHSRRHEHGAACDDTFAVFCVMLGRRPTHYRRRIHWVVLSLATGVGFLAYLWLEAPGRRAAVTTTPARMRRDPTAIVCVAVAGFLVVTGI
ncbi:hypothetical protein OG948_39155 (plasmid) [Embleya sp. NBC_00888]|uniref:hypothetical protein n=1 Tax=Embleya sp. NBC_00888 TaxID=2975960 RepID=UPI002F91BCD3|nr:hypothetical protein OG948_39155 [Embleya sp. NBC_00888]